jgi:hypothetical protein
MSFFLVFLNLVTKMLSYYLKVGHDYLVLYPSQFVARNHPAILIYKPTQYANTVKYWRINSISQDLRL